MPSPTGIAGPVISFIIAYLIVGYDANNLFAQIHWIEDVTIWDKLREYYIRTASVNSIPAFIIALISTNIINYRRTKN